jgi:hypothetical protein
VVRGKRTGGLGLKDLRSWRTAPATSHRAAAISISELPFCGITRYGRFWPKAVGVNAVEGSQEMFQDAIEIVPDLRCELDARHG